MRFAREHAMMGAGLLTSLALSALLGDSLLSLYVLLLLTAIVTVGVSVLMGHAGQVSLGQGAFYACGAYAAGILSTNGVPTLIGLCAAPVAAAALAALIGIPLLLLRGHHLAFATLAMHIIFLSLIGELREVTGGDIGLQGIPRLDLFAFELGSPRDYAYLSSIALFCVIVLLRNILGSRPGRALRALSSSEVAAASSGIPVGRYKLAVFTLSAGIAGLAGGIYTFYLGYLAPGSFPVMLSIQYVVMAAVGGMGTVSGGVVGAALVLLTVDALSRVATLSGMPSVAPIIASYAVYAVLLVSAVLFLPEGLVPFVGRLWSRRVRARRPEPADAPAEGASVSR
ncbi:MAG: branched-chain amino acid ABC transporter permease [Myxococcota bacterium]|nr:branched-chain amino acid ABC transporter permease [Myxococcota bacterium]